MSCLRCFVLLFVCVLLHGPANGGEILEYRLPGEQCGFIIERGDQYHVTAKEENGHYFDGDCIVSFRSKNANEKMFLRILRLDVDYSTLCQEDGLYIYDGTSSTDRLMNANGYGICGDSLSLPNYYKSSGNAISVRFKADSHGNTGIGFDLVITPYYEVQTQDECDGFKCLSDNKCMTIDARCNGFTQCADGSDEPSGLACSRAFNINVSSSVLLIFAVFCTTVIMTFD